MTLNPKCDAVKSVVSGSSLINHVYHAIHLRVNIESNLKMDPVKHSFHPTEVIDFKSKL